jgi:reversibly glycosylated polypeptide/UDP-arabinopyranose mutase
MTKPNKIVVVIPTIRVEQYKTFLKAWDFLFNRHEVTLITVWDGDIPEVAVYNYKDKIELKKDGGTLYEKYKSLIYRKTDSVRNLGFILAGTLKPTHILTLDDDVAPVPLNQKFNGILANPEPFNDPIQQHLDVLQKRVPLSWMNTAHDTDLYLRGVPYSIRNESPVMLSHGVWIGVPDFDGETQLKLESGQGIPGTLPYYVGPIPGGTLFPLCGMNVMVKVEALPYLYFAPMGPDTGITGQCPLCNGNDNLKTEPCSKCKGTGKIPTLNRFGDIWMGRRLKYDFDKLNWACYTGGSTILHTRASNAQHNFEQEKLGRIWNEIINGSGYEPTYGQFDKYCVSWHDNADKFRTLIKGLLK